MAIAIRGKASKSTDTALTISIAQSDFSAKPNGGDVLVAFAAASTNDPDDPVAWNTPSGWASRGNVNTTAASGVSSDVLSVWTKVAGGPPGSVTTDGTYVFDPSSDGTFPIVGVIYAISGANGTSILDGTVPTGIFSNTGGNFQDAPSVTPTVGTGSLLLCAWADFTSSLSAVTFTPPSGMTKDADLGIYNASGVGGPVGAYLSTSSLILSASGATGNKTATASFARPCVALSIAILAASSSISQLSALGAG